MRRKLRSVLIAAFGLAVAAAPGFAHHGFAVEFDKDRCTDLTGLLSALYWENPHAYFDVDVKEASGTMVTWHLEMITPKLLKRKAPRARVSKPVFENPSAPGSVQPRLVVSRTEER